MNKLSSNSKQPRSKPNRFLARWHRRIGLTAALLVLVLSVTGILLNHSDQLGLDAAPVQSDVLLSAYDIDAPELTGFSLGDNWLSHAGGNHLYLNDRELTYCAGQLAGAVAYRDNWIVACGDELLLLTASGELIERIGASYGLPQPVSQLGLLKNNGQNDALFMQNGVNSYRLDVEQLSWDIETEQQVEWSTPTALPEQYSAALLNQHLGQEITWERFVLDLHSGRLFGSWGPWLMDAAALIMVLLSLSGFYMWWQKRRLGRSKLN